MPLTRPGFALYLTGLPSSGKSTLAHTLQDMLSRRDIATQILDSDELRQIMTPRPTYSSQERDWFYQVLAFIADLLVSNGVNVIIAATAPLRAHRQAARSRIDQFLEVYVACPPEICRARDVKGLWKQADAGQIKMLPGADFPYEPPKNPEIIVEIGSLTRMEAANQVMERLIQEEFFQNLTIP